MENIKFTIKIIFELLAIVLLLVGYANESKVIEFEKRLYKRLKGKTKMII